MPMPDNHADLLARIATYAFDEGPCDRFEEHVADTIVTASRTIAGLVVDHHDALEVIDYLQRRYDAEHGLAAWADLPTTANVFRWAQIDDMTHLIHVWATRVVSTATAAPQAA